MGKVSKLLELALHPTEFKAAVNYFAFKTNLHPKNRESEPESLKRCYVLLEKTSRSFCAVIMELHPELCNAIMIFYLVLRALDTVEDDMTVDPKIKIPLLRGFYKKLDLDEWSWDGNGPNEKDRIVLVEFNTILTEYKKLKPEYQEVIRDITDKMGNGMADYILDENFNLNGVETLKDFDLYCHYVAGLVGEGLTRLSVLANFASKSLMNNMDLANSMGLFLQKTNIIRDYREDLEDKRSFYPKEIWSKYAPQLVDFTKPEHLDAALNCTSELVLNSLSHVIDCLTYLSLVKDQSTFNFCAIPQVMAIATLELVYMNPKVFQQNVKIRKGTTLSLILKSRTLKGVAEIFQENIRKIHHKTQPSNANYLKIGIQCGKIEQFIETMYPTVPKGVKPVFNAETIPPIVRNMFERRETEEKMTATVKLEDAKTTAALMVSWGLLLVIATLVFTAGSQSMKHVEL